MREKVRVICYLLRGFFFYLWILTLAERKKSNFAHDPFYISLTTTSFRIATLKYTLNSLLRQTCVPEKIYVWYSEEAYFLDQGLKLDEIKKHVGALFNNPRICFEKTPNIGPYRKLVPFLKKYSNVNVITADDDFLYPPDWAELLLRASEKYPNAIVAHRAKRITVSGSGLLPYNQWKPVLKPEVGVDLFPTGGVGILYPQSEPFDRKLMMDMTQALKIAPRTDDIWFRNSHLISKIPIVKVGFYEFYGHDFGPQTSHQLWDFNRDEDANDAALLQLKPSWKDLISGDMVR